MRKVVVTGSFDNLRSRHVRFLEEASKAGDLHVLLWSDEAVQGLEGTRPRFPERERWYSVQAMRYVREATLIEGRVKPHDIPNFEQLKPQLWVVDEANDAAEKQAFCESRGVEYRVLKDSDLKGFPGLEGEARDAPSQRKKAIVTGCFDWFHSGHVRFFEEVSTRGDLYVVVGHDANVRLLKGAGHPLFPQDERRYMVQSVRYVKRALISTGNGWMDAEPEIAAVKPDLYVVNEDGDRPEKRAFCREHGIGYVVLRRKPKEGLPERSGTNLRGF